MKLSNSRSISLWETSVSGTASVFLYLCNRRLCLWDSKYFAVLCVISAFNIIFYYFYELMFHQPALCILLQSSTPEEIPQEKFLWDLQCLCHQNFIFSDILINQCFVAEYLTSHIYTAYISFSESLNQCLYQSFPGQVWHFIPQNMEPVYCTTAKPSMLTNVSCTFAVSLILCTSKNFYSQAIHPIGLLPLKLGKWTFLSQDWHSLTKYTELPSYCASALCLFRCRFDISLRVVPSLLFLYLRLISCFFIHIFNSCQNISISSILFQISATYASNNHIPWPLIVFKTPPNSLMILPSIPLLPR